MTKVPKKTAKPQKKRKRVPTKPYRALIDRAEMFAHAYIQHSGNASAAAREVFKVTNNNTAFSKGCTMLKNPKVIKIIEDYMNIRREACRKFVEQSDYYMSRIAQFYIEVLDAANTTFPQKMQAADKLSRFAGTDLHDGVAERRAEAKGITAAARGRALLPGVPAPGTEHGGSGNTTHLDNRKTVFLLSPPPMPPGGVPTPALMEQWHQMMQDAGFVPGISDAVEGQGATVDNTPDGNSSPPPTPSH